MVTYVSQATYNAGTPEQRAGWTIDPTISSPQEVRNPVQYVPPNQPVQYGTPTQQVQLTEAQRQQVLLQQGLAYGNPNAPEYAPLFAKYQTTPQQPSVAQQQQGYLLTDVGQKKYQPSPYKPTSYLTTVPVQSPFGFMGGITTASGRGVPATIQMQGVVLSETSNQPFGIRGTLQGSIQPAETKQTIVVGDVGTATLDTSKVKAWQNYAEDANKKQLEMQQAAQPKKSIYQDIDERFQQMINERKSVVSFNLPTSSKAAFKEVANPQGRTFASEAMYGARLAVIDYPAVELTKMGLGFTQAATSGGFALRYGNPSVSPYIGIFQSITGQKPMLSVEETKAYLSSTSEGVVATFTLPVSLAVAGKAQQLISGGAVWATSSFVKLPGVSGVASMVSSSIPFRISATGVAKTLTSSPVLFGALSGVSVASQTKSIPAGIGAGLAVGAEIRAFEMVGERIIASKKAASPDVAYKEGPSSVLERNFVQTKTYSTPEEAARFYNKASSEDFVAAVKEGTRYAAYASQGKERIISIPLPEGTTSVPFPKSGEFVVNRGESGSGGGFSKMEFQVALAKLQGKEIPSMYMDVPIEGFEFPKGAELVRNPAYTEFTRSSDFSMAFKEVANQKPTFGEFVKGKFSTTFEQWYGGISDVGGFFTQKGVDFVSPKVAPMINKVASQPIVVKATNSAENMLGNVLEGAMNTKFRIYAMGSGGVTTQTFSPLRAMQPKSIPVISPSAIVMPSMAATATAQPMKVSQALQSAWSFTPAKTVTKPYTSTANIVGSFTQSRTSQASAFKQTTYQEMQQASVQGLKVSPKQSTSQTLRIDTQQSLRQDIRLDTQQSLRQSLKQDLTQGLRQSLRQDIPTKTGFLLPLNLSGMGEETSKGKKGKKQKGRYQPSFISLTLGLKTSKKAGLAAEKTGINIRGLISGKKRK